MLGAQLHRAATAAVHCSAELYRRLATSTSPPSTTAHPSVFSPSVLRGRVALVSGGTGAIGFAIARLLTQHGARTAILSRNQQRATDAAADINKHCAALNDAATQPAGSLDSPTCVGYQCDVTDSQHVNAAIKHVTHDLGAISILIAAHGVSHDALIPRTTDHAIADTLTTNLTATLYLIRSLSRHLITNTTPSSVVTIGSIVGAQGNVGQAAYAASKAGLEGLTRSASRELARYNVNVNLIAPGWIHGDTGGGGRGRGGMMGGSVGEGGGGGGGGRWVRRLEERDWVGRPGRVEEVANVALFLCTPAASYIHGAVLHVDGGLRV